jgi:molybdopterin/thiamine biosynthesis adenylyltransferase
MVESAMYELEAQITTIVPGISPCLACIYPEKPPYWKRQFPVFGAVSGTVGCMAAMEVIKLITGIGSTLSGKLLTFNLRDMNFKTLNVRRNPNCSICGSVKLI